MLSSSQLQAKAQNFSGVPIHDTDAKEPLHILVDSLNAEANLSVAGEAAMELRLLRLLVNRLRMERDYSAHPEIRNIEVVSPIFVFGLPRTGTTKLQKLLSESGDFTSMPLWMAHNPSLISGDRAEKPDQRISETNQYVEWIDHINPDIKMVHQFSAHEPEEVNPILEQGFLSSYLPAFVEVPSYIKWYAAQDPIKQLAYLRRVLQYLQWQFAIDNTKPWILKNPTFLGMEPEVKSVFPDAKLVMTHRNPSKVISSSASLILNFHKLYSDIDVSGTAGKMMVEGQAWVMQRHLDNRAGRPDLDIIDVGYGDLTKDSATSMSRLYARLGIPFSESVRRMVNDWEDKHGQHRFGVHQYSLVDFGLSEQVINEKFDDYIAKYSQFFQ